MKQIIELFKKELFVNRESLLDFSKVNKITLPLGYLVHPSACTQDVIDWVKAQDINYNATFYKDWNDIISKNRFELFIDQLVHYASTYGTDFEGITFVPNEGSNIPNLTNCKLISYILVKDVETSIQNMLYSGVALKQDAIEQIVEIIQKLSIKVDLSEVKNKEAKIILYDKLGIIPKSTPELMRLIFYKATGSTLFIQNREAIKLIKQSNVNLSDYINGENNIEVSRSFRIYRKILLAFKHNTSYNAHIVNKLKKLSEKTHIPKQESFWSNALNSNVSSVELSKHVEELNMFKCITLIQTILKNIIKSQEGSVVDSYIIRNGKIFIKKEAKSKNIDTDLLTTKWNILIEYLISKLSEKKCIVKFPKNITITAPTSTKSFIGEYPIYTNVSTKINNLILGIYWKNEWGARDLDFSFIYNGSKIGWNSSYYDSEDNNVVYSGDMTNADPEATELLYFKAGFNKSGFAKVNRYSGLENSKYSLFVASEEITSMKKGYMVDPNNILLKATDIMDSSEKSFGFTNDGKFYLYNLRLSNKQVSSSHDTISELCLQDAILSSKCALELKNLLVLAGFTIVYEDEECDIDFTNPSKDLFINLFS